MKLGIVGAGTIVQPFLSATLEVNEIQLEAICGLEKDKERMEQLSSEFSIPNIYYDYAQLLNSELDAIYIAVPNHLHYSFAKKALNAKKHVILEKPFASSYQEASELIALSQKNEVVIFEAITNQYLPNYIKTKALLTQLGDINIVQLNYSQYSRRYDQFKQNIILPVFDPKQSGGALMDLNVYNIHFIVGLFGRPRQIHYLANIEKGIDTSGILTLDYPTFKCVAIGAKDCQSPVAINIQGDLGYIHSDMPSNVYGTFEFGLNHEETQLYNEQTQSRLTYEIDAFVRIVTQQDLDFIKKANEQTLLVMEILDEARKQAGIKF